MNADVWIRSLVAAAALFGAALILPIPISAKEGAEDGDEGGRENEELQAAIAPVTGQWKKNYMSPSVGIVLYRARIEQRSTSDVTFNVPHGEREYSVPALDVRVFRGNNITKRAGFFWGVEAGAAVFLPYGKSFNDDVTVNDATAPITGTYNNILNSGIDTFDISFYGGTVFLMLKYGYRFELGFSKLGFSAGFQIGTGASLFSGGYDVYAGSRNNPVAEGGYRTNETNLDIATDFSIELALRMGRNFRLFAAAGMLMTPFDVGDENRSSMPGSEVLTDPAPTDEKYLKYALNSYDVKIDGFGISMRAGFSLNFN